MTILVILPCSHIIHPFSLPSISRVVEAERSRSLLATRSGRGMRSTWMSPPLGPHSPSDSCSSRQETGVYSMVVLLLCLSVCLSVCLFLYLLYLACISQSCFSLMREHYIIVGFSGKEQCMHYIFKRPKLNPRCKSFRCVEKLSKICNLSNLYPVMLTLFSIKKAWLNGWLH